ncbi:PREDICTED: dual specificity protein phosphatase 3-like [Branchiostoma belcheri]|uniref:protein-serine/threonine phosphatase n=1 Tax=Branchiostoma belcheri TaxID=7741 RepID=A0A6P4ZQZ7_BRABE|nr:PREDICTED: dual specificity protein phosphatase 3-like [Branchiostoma belcheri]
MGQVVTKVLKPFLPTGCFLGMEEDYEDCVPKTFSVSQLKDVLFAYSHGQYVVPSKSYNEVYKNIFVGDESSARNVHRLRGLGVTHVLNAAEGKSPFMHVQTGPEFYEDVGIDYHGVRASDFEQYNLMQHFEEAAKYIHKAVDEEGGKILVHCREGYSRSPSLVMAYLMIYKEHNVEDALITIRQKREIGPNTGFLKQLCLFNDKLEAEKQRRMAEEYQQEMEGGEENREEESKTETQEETEEPKAEQNAETKEEKEEAEAEESREKAQEKDEHVLAS